MRFDVAAAFLAMFWARPSWGGGVEYSRDRVTSRLLHRVFDGALEQVVQSLLQAKDSSEEELAGAGAIDRHGPEAEGIEGREEERGRLRWTGRCSPGAGWRTPPPAV